jgi:hypothetical protein
MSTEPLPVPVARATDPETSHLSAEASHELRTQIAERVLEIALSAGAGGITINEATAALPEFKPVSVSPIFSPLVRQGKLVRRVIGHSDKGKEIYEKRLDTQSNRQCLVHYHHTVVAKKPVASVRRVEESADYGS